MERWIKNLIIIDAIVLAFTVPLAGFINRQENLAERNQALAQAKIVSIQSATSTQAVSTRIPSVIRSYTYKKVSESEARLALAVIAKCESNNNPLAKNPRSSAKGLLQIIDGTWNSFSCTGNVYDPEDNLRCGMKIATQSGLHHWNPSRSCWINKLN